MPENPTLEDFLPTDGSTSAFQLAIAGLPAGAQAQATAAVERAAAEGRLHELDLDAVIDAAQRHDEVRERVEEARVEQGKAAEAGDFGKADEAAGRLEYELAEAQDLSLEPIEAWRESLDVAEERGNLQFADLHAGIAGDHAATAAAAAATGDFDLAVQHADLAADHAGVAWAYADEGGGDLAEAQAADQQDAGYGDDGSSYTYS